MQKKPLISRLLYRFSGHLRCRIINGNHGEPYLERYHLLRFPGGGGLYLHRFIDSDPDRGLHDHPWKSAGSLIWSGSYKELRLAQSNHKKKIVDRILKAGRLNILHGEDFHRIVMHSNEPVWTLFGHTRKFKDWGFLTVDTDGQGHYTPHEDVTNENEHKLWWKNAPRGKLCARSPL